MFTYCTEVLRFSEDATVLRLQAARLARQHPGILEDLASGALHLSALRFLVPHLTSENAPGLLAASRLKSKREVEKLVRERFPLPDVPAGVRKLPAKTVEAASGELLAVKALGATSLDANLAPRTGGPAQGVTRPMPQVLAQPVVQAAAQASAKAVAQPAPRRSVIAPLAAKRYRVQFTATAALHDKLRRAQDLLRHQVPNGDLSRVFELALDALIERLERRKFAATQRPRASRVGDLGSGVGRVVVSRAVPADVRRAVWKRDGGRCAFVGKNDRRCGETGFLEFHHIVSFARGGAATVANIALRCRSHNQYEAKLEFGPYDPHIVRESRAPWGDKVSWTLCAEHVTRVGTPHAGDAQQVGPPPTL